jgi:hypothetical protein
MNGSEMMVNAIIKGLGLNPDELKTQAGEAYSMLQTFARNMDEMSKSVARLEAITGDLAMSNRRLEIQLFSLRREFANAVNGDLLLPDDGLLTQFAPHILAAPYGSNPVAPSHYLTHEDGFTYLDRTERTQ